MPMHLEQRASVQLLITISQASRGSLRKGWPGGPTHGAPPSALSSMASPGLNTEQQRFSQQLYSKFPVPWPAALEAQVV